jgi:hypothetical protein
MFFMLTRWRRTGLAHPTLQQEATSPHNVTAQRFKARLQKVFKVYIDNLWTPTDILQDVAQVLGR